MLIKFFRTSFLIQYFALILITAAIWIPAFMSNPGLPVETALITPFYNLVHIAVSQLDIASPIVALAIILISALTLNNILIFHDLTPKNNLLPSFVFILLMGSNPLTLCTYPVILVIPLFIWLLHTLYRANDEPENFMLVFNAGMLISAISMIYPPAAIFFICLWLILLIFGIFNGRNLVISVIAFVLPYVYLFLYFFWTDQTGEAVGSYLSYFGNIFEFRMNKDIRQMAIWAMFAIFMLLPAFLRITSTVSTFNINFRKKMSATVWLMAFSLPLILFQGKVDYNTLVFLPASIMIAHYYNLFKKSVMNEIALLIMLLLVLANNFLHSFNA
jgi:hypothetical protein